MRFRMLITPALALIALALTFVSAGSAHAMSRSHRVGHALGVARHQLGDPYRYGAAGPSAFDCSGLVYYAFRHAGFRGVPRTSSGQAGFARHESRSRMRRGDLVFFYGSGGVYHVGIFTGRHHGHPWILHSPYPGKRVSYERIWTNAWFPGTLR